MTQRIKYSIILFVALALGWLVPQASMASQTEAKGEINVSEFVLEHLADSYEWHITTWGGNHISIPLPVIVKGETSGWHVFSSERIKEAAHEGKDYQGFFFSPEHHNKIYERLPNGETVRPWDLSITKNVVEIWLVVLILLATFLTCARWYKRHDSVKEEAPKGFVGAIEMLVMTIHDDVIKSSIGEKHYRRYAPYLLTVFFFIFTNNLLGLIPIFPGGANVTGNINITLFLAVGTMLMVNLFGNKEYWKEILWPNVPIWLKIPPVMPVIEIFGIFTKPFALMIRLFANMMAGHAIALALTCIIFIMATMGVVLSSSMTIVSVGMSIFMMLLEILVSFIQALVFTMLSAVFISLARVHEAEG